ncbi:MAG: energy-coupling factor transporter transmembrane component T [Verrucomicrobiota bacterium]
MDNTPKIEQIENNSFATQLDFRSKFALATSISLIAFLWESPLLGGLLTLVTLLLTAAAGVRKSYLLLIGKVMIPFFVMLWITHGFFNTDHLLRLTEQEALRPLLSLPTSVPIIGGAILSIEGTLYSLNILFKSITMVVIVSFAIFTSDPQTMVVSIVRARVPYKLAFVFSSTLRFFPVLYRDIQAIIETQKLRGVAYEKMGLIRRISVYSKIAIPLNLNALFRAQQVEVVLQAKAFSAKPQRTYLYDASLGAVDYCVIVASIVLFVTVFILYLTTSFGSFTS